MSTVNITPWTPLEKVLFRFFFLFLGFAILPFDLDFVRNLGRLANEGFTYGTLFELVRYTPQFLGEDSILSSSLVVVVVALLGTIIWTIKNQTIQEYNQLYYWLRVAVRYRLAAALLVYALIKLYPLQSPEPSLSNLNTAYGDFSAWKLFSMTLGVVPGYQSFLGGVELVSALLLLYRPTATIATLIILPFTGNVFFSNLAYEGGEAFYSAYLLVFASFLLVFDLRRLYSLIAAEQPTFPTQFQPTFTTSWVRVGRYSLKGMFIFIFVFWYGAEAKAALQNDPYQFPNNKGLPDAAGLYNVKEFTINNQVLPYSATDPIRWKDVVFEKWATVSIRSNKPVIADSSNVEHIYQANQLRNYEYLGTTGRHYYTYTINKATQTLELQNRNPHHSQESLSLQFTRPDSSTVILKGVNESRDSIHVVLEKRQKKYLFEEVKKVGRRGSLQL